MASSFHAEDDPDGWKKLQQTVIVWTLGVLVVVQGFIVLGLIVWFIWDSFFKSSPKAPAAAATTEEKKTKGKTTASAADVGGDGSGSGRSSSSSKKDKKKSLKAKKDQ